MNRHEKIGLPFVIISLVLLIASFYQCWLGADMNIWFWAAGLGLVVFLFSLINFFVPNIGGAVG